MFILYWLHGKMEIVEGGTIKFEESSTPSYEWNKEKHNWVKKGEKNV